MVRKGVKWEGKMKRLADELMERSRAAARDRWVA
jgi:hypothetical protein